MKFIYDVTIIISTDKYSTCGMILPHSNQEIMQQFTPSDQDNLFMTTLKEDVGGNMLERKSDTDQQEFLEGPPAWIPVWRTRNALLVVHGTES